MPRVPLLAAAGFAFALVPRVAGSADYVVRIVGFAYDPPVLSVTDEDTVTIEATGFHPLVADDGSFACTSDCAPPLKVGENPYRCGNHGGFGMAGSVTVIARPLYADGFEDPAAP